MKTVSVNGLSVALAAGRAFGHDVAQPGGPLWQARVPGTRF